jgi:hypothetical protein
VSKRLGSPYCSGRVDHARRKKIGALSDGHAGGVPEMTNLSPFFEFVLLLVVPGALIILLVALLWTGET